MKKIFLFLMATMILASAFFLNVGSARADDAPTFVGAHSVNGKGVAFIFDLNGLKLRTPNLKGAVLFLNGNIYPLSCTVNKGEDKIVCTATGKLSDLYAGDQGTISLLGWYYSVIIPPRLEMDRIEDECGRECD